MGNWRGLFGEQGEADMKWWQRELFRYLATWTIAAVLFYAMGMMHSFEGSVARAAYDCRNFASFQYKDEYFVCQVLSNGRDKGQTP